MVEQMICQEQLIIFRLHAGDNRWKKIKAKVDRFETLPLDDWEFLISWLRDRNMLKYKLRQYGKNYTDSKLDAK